MMRTQAIFRRGVPKGTPLFFQDVPMGSGDRDLLLDSLCGLSVHYAAVILSEIEHETQGVCRTAGITAA